MKSDATPYQLEDLGQLFEPQFLHLQNGAGDNDIYIEGG